MDSGSSSKERASSTVDDRDVVELKKAMATGSAKEQPVASAAGAFNVQQLECS